MVGPFLGIPLLLGTLTLSVDLIEYDPQPEQDRLSDRPIPEAVSVADSPSTPPTRLHTRTSVSSASVVSAPDAGAVDDLLDVTLAGDAPLPNARPYAAPPPYMGSTRR